MKQMYYYQKRKPCCKQKCDVINFVFKKKNLVDISFSVTAACCNEILLPRSGENKFCKQLQKIHSTAVSMTWWPQKLVHEHFRLNFYTEFLKIQNKLQFNSLPCGVFHSALGYWQRDHFKAVLQVVHVDWNAVLTNTCLKSKWHLHYIILVMFVSFT